ncbi:MAG TPA: Cof-type HAD-IIB family hydrolase [Rectinemataceae bacterium]
MEIKLIALDLDDTLLDSGLEISEENRMAVASAEDAGIEIVLASGRNYQAMRRYVELLGLDRQGNFLVCSNGAETHEARGGALVERLSLSPDLCREIAQAVESRGFPWQVYQAGKILASQVNPWALLDQELSGLLVEQAPPADILFASGQTKFVVPGEPERISVLFAELSVLFAGRAEVVTSKPYFLELLPLGANKGAALSRLAARLGLGMESVMAIGDAMNDLGMIRAAGWGCAPANALEEVKRAARIVSQKTNEEHAVADLIYSVALSSRPPERR